MKAKEELPEHLRCNRTDGRRWRCNRPVKDGKKLCEIHYLQGLHRQHKEKVPESLKLQREYTRKLKGKASVNIRARKIEKSVKQKRRNLARELVRMVVRREVEKRRDNVVDEETAEGDIMRRLPNGIMVISQSPAWPRVRDVAGNGRSLFDAKVGVDSGIASRRRFRSKNIEPLPIGAVQVLPYKRNGENCKRGGKKKCHRCKSSKSACLIKCLSCRKEFYCMECIKNRYFSTQEEVKMQCPVCRKTCSCEACMGGRPQTARTQELLSDENRADRILNFHYLICMLLPVLKQINQEQSIELELEAKIKGIEISEVQIQHAESNSTDQNCCNNCNNPILGLHRTCSSCSFDMCLICWWHYSRKNFPEEMELFIKKRKSCMLGKEGNHVKQARRNIEQEFGGKIDSLSLPSLKACNSSQDLVSCCPTEEFGGCGKGVLKLSSSFPLNWIEDLETKAEEIVCSYDFPESFDGTSCCTVCAGPDHDTGFQQSQQASARMCSNDNILYYPTATEICADKREHFQKHWGRGHPVIVRDVLQKAEDLNWDPLFMFYSYLEGSIAKYESGNELPSCLEWCEVEISVKQKFMGSLRGRTNTNTRHETVKLKAWLSSRYFQEQFPHHYAEIVQQLPLQEYMNPETGLLNLAAKPPSDTTTPPYTGPYVHISYNSSEEQAQTQCISKLGSYPCDMVNILAHTTDDRISPEKLNKMKKLMKKLQSQSGRESTSTSEDQSLANNKGEDDEEEEEANGLMETGAEDLLSRKKIARVSWLSTAAQEPILGPSRDSNYCSVSGSLSSIRDAEESQRQKHCTDNEESHDCSRKEAAESCGAQWDIFRREDVPKLIEYLKRHSHEFLLGPGSNVVHPILDECFFLDATHKMKLKEEFKIEAWTFEQHLGEAVIVPAGCPYQIRNLKSCVNVILHFVSPESVKESIQLMDELHSLPNDHEAKLDKLEVKKMAMDSLSGALKEIHELTCSKQVND